VGVSEDSSRDASPHFAGRNCFEMRSQVSYLSFKKMMLRRKHGIIFENHADTLDELDGQVQQGLRALRISQSQDLDN
jgi:hypothetical protein